VEHFKTKKLACECCGQDLPFLEGWFSCADMEAGQWRFVCRVCPDGFYDVEAKRFFLSPQSTVDWLSHLFEKRWFDASKFLEFMHRLRANGGFYFCS
jgi:hypothetical protein